ncbi:hypothetical protein Tco_0939186 [Tanacetum coccineum]|uniref:Uncharacterized protein n=1 Tax=Tanacetum coccineum TaxID=301880 RepID=A0ABQ5DJB9_9ASTR
MAKSTKTNKDKDLKISELKAKSIDDDKGSRSKITQHEGTSLQQDKVQDQDSRTQQQDNLKDLPLGEIISLNNIESNKESRIWRKNKGRGGEKSFFKFSLLLLEDVV